MSARRAHLPIPAYRTLGLALIALLCACGTPGPRYAIPDAPLPAQFGGADWRTAHPADALPKGDWWQIYQDTALNALEQQALTDNPDLQGAQARLRQAQAFAQASEAAFLPMITANGSALRNRTSANRPSLSPLAPPVSTLQNDFNPFASVRWEADVSGRLALGKEAAQAAVGQSQADQENVRLLLTTGVAINYLGLRATDADLQALGVLITEQERTVALLQRRTALGQGTGLDSLTYESALASSRVQQQTLQVQREALISALAALVGKPASDFHIAATGSTLPVPLIPPGLPSTLLERRPDVASAERAVAQANAQIGIAEAARYPALVLGLSDGFESRSLGSLLTASSVAWSFGATVAQNIYDGGRIDASVAAARAGHQSAVARYRASVLQAVAEVESALAAERVLAEAETAQQNVLRVARQQQSLLTRKREGGYATALDQLASDQGVTLAERTEVQLRGQRMLASVYLVKALGGSW